MVEAERIASDALTLIVIGIDAPSGAEEIFARAIQECGKLRSPNKLEQRSCGFYFGSAYEYGIAVKPDTSIAWKWYVLAGQAGSKIALREAARLDQSQPR